MLKKWRLFFIWFALGITIVFWSAGLGRAQTSGAAPAKAAATKKTPDKAKEVVQPKGAVQSPSAVDPLLKAETHKSAFQRRQEANQRLLETAQGQQQQAAKAAAAAKAPKTAVAAAPGATPTGINPPLI